MELIVDCGSHLIAVIDTENAGATDRQPVRALLNGDQKNVGENKVLLFQRKATSRRGNVTTCFI